MKNLQMYLLGLLVMPLTTYATEKLTKLEKNRIELKKEYLKTIHGGPTFATVGGDAACDYQIGTDSLQDAVDSGLPEIRLATNITYSKVELFSNISIIGGYDDCTAAANNIIAISPSKSIINGDPTLATFIINTSTITIGMKNLTIQNGTIGILNFGTDNDLIIQDVLIQNNTNIVTTASAGIHLLTTGSTYLENVRITNNISSGDGGGIYCNGNNLIIVGDSSIDNNAAGSGAGGGIYAGSCDVTIVGGSNLSFPTGISDNLSASIGGGLFTDNSLLTITGGEMTIENITYGDLTTPYLFFNNLTSNVGTNSGGGIYANNSTANLTNISMVNNHASGSGGAIYAATNSQINITRSPQKCWSDISCNFIQGNTADLVSGAFHFTSGADGLIQASTIKLNRADIATVLNVGSANSSVRIESSFIYENGDFGNGLYNDDTVIRVNGAELILLQTTMVNNDATDQVINAISNTSLKLLNSIVYNPTVNAPFYNQGSGSFTRGCLFVDDTNNTTSSGVTAIGQSTFNAIFIDPLNDDYHLTTNSFLIDQCTKINIGGLDVISDIDNQKYGYEYPGVNGSGLTSYDVGADELSDILFSDGFE